MNDTPRFRINPSQFNVVPGRPYPMGAAIYEEGVRFTIFSRHATGVWLALFESVADREPCWEYAFDPEKHRTGDVWSIFVQGMRPGMYYKYRFDGPHDPAAGHHYDPSCYVLDPYAKALVGEIHDGTMKCVTAHDELDWTTDRRPKIPMEETIIYECHVRGFTKDPSSGVEQPGTYQGLIEKIPHLKELGVTAVELLPIHEFGETLLGRCSLDTGEELINYWGYSNIGFFAPSGRYACNARGLEHLDEFRRMVHALHENGMEVILDVVFNHTSEGNEKGPTLCFRGIDNSIYYMLGEKGDYLNYSGCGNTVNCNHPLVRDFILDCLRYWVASMHIDGFRFDLASILGRDVDGDVLEDAPLIERIAEDPVLRDTKLIAEAWDAGGAYQVGSFGDARWAEWNGKYRDTVRCYWRGDRGLRGEFATRLTGSADLYEWAGRSPLHSINFITAHDGFTLRDLVSYNVKHNEANGENNRDGSNTNYSFNCGEEGDSKTPRINALRDKMQKNYLATLFLSLGVPMLLGGDEFGRSQQGNNNAYCQDNAISWFNWELLRENRDLFRFCKKMIAFRKSHSALQRATFFTGEAESAKGQADLIWYAPDGGAVNWQAHDSELACLIQAHGDVRQALFLIFNNTEDTLPFTLPEGNWIRRIDTELPAPQDIMLSDKAPSHTESKYTVAPQSLVVLERA